jgi:hypothetical protein
MNKDQQRSKDLESVLAIITGLVVISAVFSDDPIEFSDSKMNFIYIAGSIGVLSLFSKTFSKYLSIAWMKLAEGMGYVMSKVVLSIIFFVFLSPIAFLYRLATKKSMKKNSSTDTVFDERNYTFAKKDFDNPW